MKKLLLILSIVPFLGISQFTERNPLSNGAKENEFFIADINGDDLGDIVYHNPNGVFWYEQNDDEQFVEIHQIYTRSNAHVFQYIITLAVSDIDNDGDIDVAFGTQGEDGPGIAWLENLGDGVFSEPNTIVSNVDMRRIYFEDIDGDGDDDLIANIIGGDLDFSKKLVVIENIGGDFGSAIDIDYFPSGEKYSNCGDIDGDGDLDIIVADNFLNELNWYENLGDGTFESPVLITTDFDYIIELQLEDMDADGDVDVLFTSYSNNLIAWQENDGTGVFPSQHELTTIQYPRCIRMADFDMDSDLDIIYMWHEIDELNNSKLSIMECVSPGVYSDAVIFDFTVNEMMYFSLGDINMDGMIDILHRGFSYLQCSYIINTGGLSFDDPKIVINQTSYASESLIKDLDGNDLEDVIIRNAHLDKIFYYKNIGDNKFSQNIIITDEANKPSAFNTIDVENDGDFDIIYASKTDSTILWIENSGDGTFAPPNIILANPGITNQLLTMDFDDDGDEDLIRTAHSSDYSISFFENIDGEFGTETEIPNDFGFIKKVIIRDFDNDGTLDILVNTYSNKLYWFENIDGIFEPQVELANLYCADFDLCDINGDYLLDVVAIESGGGEIATNAFWMENLGDETFGPSEIILASMTSGTQIEVKDMDNDGQQDVVIAGWYTPDGGFPFGVDPEFSNIIWIRVPGDGTFDVPFVLIDNIMTINNFTIGDIEGDGDYDVFFSSELDHKLGWLENGFYSPQQVSGNIYYDENENGIREVDEVGLGGVQIKSAPLGDFSYTFIDGNYIINFDDVSDGDYLISPEDLDHWSITSDPSEHTITIDDAFIGDVDKDFGMYPSDDETEVVGSLIGLIPRCDSEVNYWISYENIGGAISSGIIELELNEEITFVSSLIAPDSIVDNSIYWTYEELFYFDEQLIHLIVEMPSFDFMGDTLTSYSTITALDEYGDELFVHEDSISQILTCAYDPNDKTVSPKGEGDFGNIPPTTPYLEYTVRFQNTGTDTAFNIVIKDQLSENLDWSSLEPLGSSHDMSAYIDHTGELSFTFNDIMLPDSNVNELASHGFVNYRIDLLPELPLGTVITNTANIYFDANPAVVTNTTINTLFEAEDDGSGIEELSANSVLVYPNPFTEITTVYLSESLSDDITIRVFSVLGKEIYSNSNFSGNQLEISAADLGKGLYIITVEDNQTNQLVHSSKLIVQ